jgi:hypothetical protein
VILNRAILLTLMVHFSGAALAEPTHASGWDMELDECLVHQQQGVTTVLIAGDHETLVFGFSKSSFSELSPKAMWTMKVYFDGPSLKGRNNLWGTVDMGIAPIHDGKALIFVPTPSFWENLVKQSSVTFEDVTNRSNRTTIRLTDASLGVDLVNTCISTPD